jgi:hypothetical protein
MMTLVIVAAVIAIQCTTIANPVRVFAQSELEMFSAEGIVAEISISELNASNREGGITYFDLKDWDRESGRVLFASGPFIGTMNADATEVRLTSLPSGFHDASGSGSPVRKAMFAGNGTVLALARNELLAYGVDEGGGLVGKGRYPLDGDVVSFDILRTANGTGADFNLALAESHSLQTGEDEFEHWNEIWLADSKGNKILKLYHGNLASDIAASHDGKMIAIPTAERIEGQAYFGLVRLLILDVERNETSVVFEEAATSPHTVRWSPNDKLVAYIQGAGVRVPIAELEVASVNGSYRQTLYWGLDAPTSYVISDDGGEILIGISPYLETGTATKLYKLELAHPMPEFGPAPAAMTAAVALAMIAVVLGRIR